MSFREKGAWITLVTLIVLSLFFLGHLPQPWTLSPAPSPFMFHVLLLAVSTFIAVEVVAYVIIAFRAPKDAKAPKDEREQLIGLKATRIAAYVYAVLSLTSIFMIHFGANQIGVAYCVTLSFVISQIVNRTARIIYYRRGV